jgi:hypothetical protein
MNVELFDGQPEIKLFIGSPQSACTYTDPSSKCFSAKQLNVWILWDWSL